jgi:hypothetical protein
VRPATAAISCHFATSVRLDARRPPSGRRHRPGAADFVRAIGLSLNIHNDTGRQRELIDDSARSCDRPPARFSIKPATGLRRIRSSKHGPPSWPVRASGRSFASCKDEPVVQVGRPAKRPRHRLTGSHLDACQYLQLLLVCEHANSINVQVDFVIFVASKHPGAFGCAGLAIRRLDLINCKDNASRITAASTEREHQLDRVAVS